MIDSLLLMSIDDDFQKFLTVKKHLDVNSVRVALSRYKILATYLSQNNLNISKQTVEDFLYDLNLKKLRNVSINSYIFSFRYLYAYLKDRNIEVDNFLEGIESLPKQRTIITVLTYDEVQTLLNTDLTYGKFRGIDATPLNHIYKVFTRFLYSTGCRFEEASNLVVENVDLPSGKIIFTDTKNHDHRYVYITDPLVSLLKEFIKNKQKEDFVFKNFMGSKIIPQTYNDDLKKRALKAGITKSVHPHLLRHSYATHLYLATHDIGLVQLVLGHKDIKSTMIYIHLAGEIIKDGMMKHPIARNNLDPSYIIKMAMNNIESYQFENDTRFNRLKVVNAINTFNELLYQSLY